METIGAFNINRLPAILFGSGSFSKLPQMIGSYGGVALILTGATSFQKTGRRDMLTRQLSLKGVSCHTVSIPGEPTVEMIDAIAGKYRGSRIQVVAAIGGGSVIDCGKAVSAMLSEKGSVKNYLEDVGTQKPSGLKIPFIAVPTTAGTGSEATKNAVVCSRDEGFKKSLRHDSYIPDIALVDPELTLGAPREVIIACGLDAVSQLIESYTSTKANVFTDSLALKALALAAESLPRLALENASDIQLNTNMSYAALASGITLSYAGLGAIHGLAGPLGGLISVPHGVVCGKLLFPVMTFVVKKVLDEQNRAAQKRFADIGRLFNGGDQGNDDRYWCRRFLDVLHQWSRMLQLPQLSHFGLTAACLEKTIALADNKNSPARLSSQEMKVILETVR